MAQQLALLESTVIKVKTYQIPFTGLQRQYNLHREEILDATDQVLRSGQYMSGQYTAQFEAWLAQRNQTGHAITCHSGTHALEIIAEYWKLDHKQQPTVLVPNLSFVATANAFVRAGWNIHFIDTDVNGIFDPDCIPEHLEYQAIVLVGLYGSAVSHTGSVRNWTKWIDQDVTVIEDGAQNWLGDAVRVGVATAISFDPMKNLACYGNGGAVLTNNEHFAGFARSWREHNKGEYKVQAPSNSRMSEIDCATMMVKTKYIDQWQQRRREIAAYWQQQFKHTSARCLITQDNEHNHAFHKFVVDVDYRNHLQSQLAADGIVTKIHYEHALNSVSPLSGYPGPDMMSVSSLLSCRVLSLPIYPELTDAEVEHIASRVQAHVS